ncbi:hypothetical protein [Nocardia sp. NPDC049149]|uniref:hypothetical protein n=1 Tax=Nocardia sp. NPDC049149 TaxID=3364315 RepID=UPI0037247C74
MELIVHLIRLHADTDAAAFESWVREVDYATCPELPSIRSFSVQRIPDSPRNYFEVIQVDDLAEFERDTRTPAFARLVAAFDTMAAVTTEIAGTRVGPGYYAA